MKAWKVGQNPKTIEVWEVDEDTGELSKMTKLEFEHFVSRDWARNWMLSHYPTPRPAKAP